MAIGEQAVNSLANSSAVGFSGILENPLYLMILTSGVGIGIVITLLFSWWNNRKGSFILDREFIRLVVEEVVNTAIKPELITIGKVLQATNDINEKFTNAVIEKFSKG